MKKTIILGGGITGLSCAYELVKGGAQGVTLVETQSRLGGKVLSPRSGRLIFEGGPDSFVTTKPWALELVRELGLEAELLATNPAKKSMYVYAGGKLRRFPEGLLLMAPTQIMPFLQSDLLSMPAKLRMGLDWILPAGNTDRDVSIGEFGRRRFGAEALERIIAPVMAGIHAGDPDKLSLRSTFPQFLELEKKYGSLIRGMRAAAAHRPKPSGKTSMFMTLRGGLESMTEALAQRIGSVARLNTHIDKIERVGKSWRVTAGDQTLEAERIICTFPANRAAEACTAVSPQLHQALAAIPFASTATLSLAYSSEHFPITLDGFGFVVDRREEASLTGATYTSTKFPGRVPLGTVLMRCFLGGAGREEILSEADEDLTAAVQRDLQKILNLQAEPTETRLLRWPAASPQYNVGHEERVAAIAAATPEGLTFAGASYKGVGLPDCIRAGRAAAQAVLKGEAVPVV
jgi:oxygen-dependent protoporphyrinogen oxidase